MELLFLKQVDSTNRYAKDNIKNLSDMSIVYADIQTAGRGRFKRSWNDTGTNNIYASIVLKPSLDLKEVYANLTQYLCLVLAEVFEEYGIKPTIKWPNDILINGKKISGILAEVVFANNTLEGIVLGFGVNLNSSQEEINKINQPATSLNLETGMDVNREIFLKNVIDKFCLMYNKFIEDGFLLIRDDYIRRAGFLNKHITLKVFDKEISGIASDITEQGALKIFDKNNDEHVLLIGDIL